jgi:hypothetical protein
VQIPLDAVIPIDKLTRYLLVQRPEDDKSQFLALAGFTQSNHRALLAAIRHLAATREAVTEGENEYGEFLRVDGHIVGPNGRSLSVTTIWLRWRTDNSVHFVTLVPRRRTENEP